MCSIHLNFSEMEEFEALPAGVYRGVVTSVEQEPSNSGEYDKITWSLTLAEPAVVGDQTVTGRKLRYWTSLSPKALWKLRDTLIDLGVGTKESLKASLDFDPTTICNKTVDALLSVETYESRLVNRVERIMKTDPKRKLAGAAPPVRRI